MSALPPKADITRTSRNSMGFSLRRLDGNGGGAVRFLPTLELSHQQREKSHGLIIRHPTAQTASRRVVFG